MTAFAPLFHVVFLVVLATSFLLFLVWALFTRRRGAFWLNVCFAFLFLALLAHQAGWQLSGFGSLGFQKFQRRYDSRPSTLARTSERRGRLLDRDGKVLAQAIPGKRWGHDSPLGAAALHVVGYASREYGLSGLSRVFDARLCGVPPPGEQPTLFARAEPQDIRITLDSTLQQVAFEALQGRKGAVVVLEPTTGDILALVSSPSVDEADLRSAMTDAAHAPLLNRATQGLYPPGSVFKLFTAALALTCNKATSYACPPSGWAPALYTKPIRDTHPRPADDPMLALRPAFAESSNIWFAKAAVACGWTRFSASIKQCAVDNAFTLASCGERSFGTASGRVPDLSTSPNRVAYLGFGQGDLRVTPLHIAVLTASVANGGLAVFPHLEAGAKTETRRFWSPEVAERVRLLMRASVLEGTSRGIAMPGLTVCGKTGTAETSGRDHAWFTCFAPAEHPRIVVTVLVENGGFGAATALPVAKKILQAWQKKDSRRRSNLTSGADLRDNKAQWFI